MPISLKIECVFREAIVKLIVLAGISVSGFGVAMAQTTQTEIDEILHGEALAKANCSKCHAIGLEGDSPNEKAPAFRNIEERRTTETIALMLKNKESPEHSDMPQFEITATQALDIAEWIYWVQPVAHGKRLVEKNCARCHAIGLDDESSFLAAPPFRNLSIFYPIDALEEAFAERIETGHPAMPVFEVTPDQLRDMLDYIASLQKP